MNELDVAHARKEDGLVMVLELEEIRLVLGRSNMSVGYLPPQLVMAMTQAAEDGVSRVEIPLKMFSARVGMRLARQFPTATYRGSDD